VKSLLNASLSGGVLSLLSTGRRRIWSLGVH